MDEEGLRETDENKDISIAQPIPMDDEEFLKQLDELEKACTSESDDIKNVVAGIVRTYKPFAGGK